MEQIPLSRKETLFGWVYLLFQLVALPNLLILGNQSLSSPLSSSALNFVFFLLNFLAVILIFRRFLLRSLKAVGRKPLRFWLTVVLGLIAYVVWLILFGLLVIHIRPDYVNLNDQTLTVMAGTDYLLMAIGTVILVPPVEECFYRGLIFRGLSDRSVPAAYLISAAAFCMIHIMGFLGVYSPTDFLLAFLQYLPAGLLLAWSYRHTGTIFAPVFIHALINLRAIWLMR